MSEDDAIQLRRQLNSLQNQIRTNEQIWSHFRQIEFDMIGGQTIAQVLTSLINGLLANFPNVDFVAVAHIDDSYELTRLLRDEERNEFRGFVPVSREFIDSIFANSSKPVLGTISEPTRCTLFPDKHPEMIGSVAMAPLVLHGQIVGSLNQASRNPKHFQEGNATDLLQHLAAVTAMCIDNGVSHEKLKQDGLTDPLTQIANRRFFERRLQEEVERVKRSRNELACIVVDVDHFKKINDVYGHVTGDAVLQRVAAELGKDLRSSDVLARYGGEEFVLLLPGTGIGVATEIAERLRIGLEQLEFHDIGYDSLKVSATLGLALVGRDPAPEDLSTLFERADSALYEGKQSGRNQVVVAQ
jgi:two-component system cell cycle response regulator